METTINIFELICLLEAGIILGYIIKHLKLWKNIWHCFQIDWVNTDKALNDLRANLSIYQARTLGQEDRIKRIEMDKFCIKLSKTVKRKK